MIGIMVNVIAVLAGSAIGLIFKRGIPKKVADAIMLGIGLCTMYIGISGAIKGQNQLVAIIAMVLGAAVGTVLDIDRGLNTMADRFEARFRKPDGSGASLAEGFVTASLLFCIGAMTIVGSLNAGLTGDNQMLYTKSVLDFISAIMLSATLGIGVMCSALFVLVFQGSIALVANLAGQGLSAAVIDAMSCVGSVLIVGLGLNVMGITKLKIMNYLPAVFLPITLVPLWDWITGLIVIV